MIPIYEKLQEHYPEADYYFSSATKTGHQEAKRSLPKGRGYFFLPVDLSWVMRRFVRHLRPNLLILSESDFWLNLMQEVKSQKGKVVLLNGKISEKSTRRFATVPSKRLFDQIDLYLIQNSTYASRFQSLGIPNERITITGNLKLAIEPKTLTPEEKASFRSQFGFNADDPVITVASTHDGEEELIISRIPNTYKILLAARHPERFPSLKTRYQVDPRVIVVDKMGILSSCFQVSELAIVGGSFIPGVGGHNIFEPIQAGIPVLFGPFMETQPDLVEMVLNGKAGIQTQAETLDQAIHDAHALKENAQTLSKEGSEVLEKTVKALDLNHLLG